MRSNVLFQGPWGPANIGFSGRGLKKYQFSCQRGAPKRPPSSGVGRKHFLSVDSVS